jgi:hypothetical protein
MIIPSFHIPPSIPIVEYRIIPRFFYIILIDYLLNFFSPPIFIVLQKIHALKADSHLWFEVRKEDVS